ncbi:efflux RND transporter periplasmic adaptor subunit [Thermodesulfobacteriota bacterium]
MIKRIIASASIFLIFICTLPPPSTAENNQKKEMPPANVVVSKVTNGMIAPEDEFIGTIYYIEVSDVSPEVSGSVESITFEEGQRTKKGELLVKLVSNLLEKKLEVRVASYEQTLSDLERAKSDFERIENLYKKKTFTEKDYDNQRFQVKGLGKKADSLKAEVELLEIELKKMLIKAPFDGVIIEKHVARGEWLSPGKTVATIARDDAVDLIVDVPEKTVKYLKPGMAVSTTVAGKQKRGIITAIIPRGDIATRTFPVKIRIKNSTSLFEGMQARVRLPVGEKINSLLVHRDALLTAFGKTVCVAVIASKAMIIPVQLVGYQGMKAGINAKKISEGMKVVIKGNERLRNGQPVIIIKEVE